MLFGKESFLHDAVSAWRKISTSQKFLYLLYALLLVYYTLHLFRAVENRIGLSFFTPVSDAFFILISIIGSINVFIKKVRIVDVGFILLFVGLYLFSTIFNYNTSRFAEENTSYLLFVCLPMFFVGLTVDRQTSLTLFVLIAYWALFLQVLFLYVIGIGVNEYGEDIKDSMAASYSFLPFVCLLVYNAFARKGIIHWIIAAIAVFILFSLGTRGPIICIAFFIAFYVVFWGRFKHSVLIKVMVGAFAVLIFTFSNELAIAFSLLSERLGLSTRVFEKILDDKLANINESSYRDYIWEGVISKLKTDRTLFDFNFYADRFFNNMDTQYVHNLELELLCDFGLIGGGILLLVLLGIIFKAFRCSWKKEEGVLLIVYFSSAILQLQFSNSFLMCPEFWFFLGMCISLIRAKDPSKKANVLHRHVPFSKGSTKLVSV